MHVRLLGPVEVRGAVDQPWVRPAPQQRLVLAALAAPPGRPREVSTLADALWEGGAPDTAHRLLQGLVSRLRASLGQQVDTDGPLHSVENGWRLDLEADQVDTLQFDWLVAHAEERASARDLDAAGDAVEAALALWRGRAFGGLGDRALLVGEALRLEERRLDALELRTQLRIAGGAYGPAIAQLKDLLVDQPLRERSWGLLMVALYRAGRQADALVAYQRLRERLVEELGAEPGPELRRLHERILRHDLNDLPGAGGDLVSTAPVRRPAGLRGLPPTRTTFVGRRTELEDLGHLLAEHAVVSVVGLGGVGKTRLAVAAARAAEPRFDRGAFVDLSRVGADRLLKAVATTLGVVELAHRPLVDGLVDHVRRGPSLLVVDNCEHLVAEVGDLVEQVTTAAPDLVVLATSRERLGVSGEHVYAVGPLAVSTGGASAAVDRSEAASLFLDRVGAVAPTAEVDPVRVEALCRRLDGLPLAIELAAARVASLGVDGLLAGLEDRLRLLTAAGGGPARHRSLRAVLDWSHDLLDDDEQRAFRRLGVFTGRFDLAAATAVVTAVGAAGTEVSRGTGDVAARSHAADLVGRLADKSLLVHHDGRGGSRWRMLDTVRDYALERVAAHDDDDLVRRRHLRWALATAHDLRDRMGAGRDWREAFREAEGDLRAALDTPLGTPAGRAADGPTDGGLVGRGLAGGGLAGREPVGRGVVGRGEVDRAGARDRDLDAAATDRADRLDLAFAVAALQSRSGSYSAAQDACATAVGLARGAAGPEALARAALGASVSGMMFGVSDRSRVAWLEEALAALGPDPTALRVQVLARLAMELYWGVDRQRSLTLVDEAMATAVEVGDDAAHAQALYARHYLTRGPESADRRLAMSTEVVERAERGGATELALAGRAAHVVDLLAAGDLTAMDAALGILWEAADRLQQPAFQWYTDVYQVVRALVSGRFADADALTTTAIAAGRHVAEFSVGLTFAQAITDLRDPGPALRRHRAARFDDMARRFPQVLVWRCLGLLDDLVLAHPGPRSVTSPPVPPARHDGVNRVRASARRLADEVLDPSPRDAHWVVEAVLLAEVAADLGDAHLAAQLDEALRPHAGRLAVAGRVGACRGAVSHALGLARLTMEDLDRAVADLGDAVAQHDGMGARPYLARSLSVLAQAHEVRGSDGDDRAAHDARARAEAVGADLRPHGSADWLDEVMVGDDTAG